MVNLMIRLISERIKKREILYVALKMRIIKLGQSNEAPSCNEIV